MMRKGGFSLFELLFTFVILGILASIAVPGFIRWLPGYRLKNAARDLSSNMHLARMGALKNNADWAIVFDTGVTPGRYFVCSDNGANDTWDGPTAMGGDDVAERTVDLRNYKSAVAYGHGNAATDIPGDTFPGDNISYTSNVAVFNPRGTCKGGYVYFDNLKKTTTYGIGTRTSGVIRLRKWTGSAWE